MTLAQSLDSGNAQSGGHTEHRALNPVELIFQRHMQRCLSQCNQVLDHARASIAQHEASARAKCDRVLEKLRVSHAALVRSVEANLPDSPVLARSDSEAKAQDAATMAIQARDAEIKALRTEFGALSPSVQNAVVVLNVIRKSQSAARNFYLWSTTSTWRKRRQTRRWCPYVSVWCRCLSRAETLTTIACLHLQAAVAIHVPSHRLEFNAQLTCACTVRVWCTFG